MGLEIKGLFKAATKPKEYGSDGKTVTKFYVDIDLDSQYPSVAEFQFFDNKIDTQKFTKGDPINVCFNISGRKTEYVKDGKTVSGFFQSLKAWRVDLITTHSAPAPQAATPHPANGYIDLGEDLPF